MRIYGQKTLKQTIEEMEFDYGGMTQSVAEWVQTCKVYRQQYTELRSKSRQNPTDAYAEKMSRKAWNRFNQCRNTIANFIVAQLRFFGVSGKAVPNFNLNF